MYKIIWDTETRGIRLISHNTEETLGISPRPVFWEELELLKLYEFGWRYPKVKEPLMWACNKQYFYNGKLMFEAKDGNVYDDATIIFQPNIDKHITLEPVNLKEMLASNKDFMFLLESFIGHQRVQLNRIKPALVEQGKTGRWLAEEHGKSACTVSRWCSNTAQPDLKSWALIAQCLNVHVSDLISRKIARSNNSVYL